MHEWLDLAIRASSQSFIHSFIHSAIHAFIYSCFQPFMNPAIHTFSHHASSHSCSQSCIQPFMQPAMHTSSHICIQPFVQHLSAMPIITCFLKGKYFIEGQLCISSSDPSRRLQTPGTSLEFACVAMLLHVFHLCICRFDSE